MRIAGVRVVDATKKVRIVITNRDINKGDTKDPAGCAAAVACLRQIEGVTEARIHVGRSYLKMDDKWVRFNTSPALRSEIIAFDRGGMFEPGEYDLKPIPPSARAGVKSRKGYRATHPHKPPQGKKKRGYHTATGIRQHGANR